MIAAFEHSKDVGGGGGCCCPHLVVDKLGEVVRVLADVVHAEAL